MALPDSIRNRDRALLALLFSGSSARGGLEGRSDRQIERCRCYGVVVCNPRGKVESARRDRRRIDCFGRNRARFEVVHRLANNSDVVAFKIRYGALACASTRL